MTFIVTLSPIKSLQPTSPPRRRAPALERLPRWLFTPVHAFIHPRPVFPLPQKVAVRGKPFYDWDAWALTLLTPALWRRRGPWERLVRCCHRYRPHTLPHPDHTKAALVRIVVADVVSHLVDRVPDGLTPEDRNWITSVASRQKGRDPRKPTLMLLLDFAFPLFDLSAYCRTPHPVLPAGITDADCDAGKEPSPVITAYNLIVKTITAQQTAGMHTDVAIDRVVQSVLQLVDTPNNQSDGKNSTECIHHITQAITKLLNSVKAPRWNRKTTHEAEMQTAALTNAANAFSHAASMHSSNSGIPIPKSQPALSTWLRAASQGSAWHTWAQLASDVSYINTQAEDGDSSALRTRLCESITHSLFARQDTNDMTDGPNAELTDFVINAVVKPGQSSSCVSWKRTQTLTHISAKSCGLHKRLKP